MALDLDEQVLDDYERLNRFRGWQRRAWLSYRKRGRVGVKNPIPELSPAAYYELDTGITVTGSGVSQWDDQSGNGRHLTQSTDANRPAKQSDGSILFDGTNDSLKAAAFTLNQPTTVCMLVNPVTHTDVDELCDGDSFATMFIQQTNPSPNILLYAGVPAATNSGLVLGSFGKLRAIFNGPSSSIKIDGAAATTGNPGASNAGGFTLGSAADGSRAANIQVKEVVLFSSVLSDANWDAIRTYWAAI